MPTDTLTQIIELEKNKTPDEQIVKEIKLDCGPKIVWVEYYREPDTDPLRCRVRWAYDGPADITAFWIIAGESPGDKLLHNSLELSAKTRSATFEVAKIYPKLCFRLSYMISERWNDVDHVHLDYTSPIQPPAPPPTPPQNTELATLFNIGRPPSSVSGLTVSEPIVVRNKKGAVIEYLDLRQPLKSQQPQIYAENVETLTINHVLARGDLTQKDRGFKNAAFDWAHFFVCAINCRHVIIKNCEAWDFHHGIWLDNCQGWDISHNRLHDNTFSDVAVFQGRALPDSPNSIHHNVTYSRYSHAASGDRLSYLSCIGTKHHPLLIDDNYCEFIDDNNCIYNAGANGGFVMLGDYGDWDTEGQAYLKAHRNVGINTGHYLFNISGGYGCELIDNIGITDEYNQRPNRGVGVSVVNQYVYDKNKINTDFGYGVVAGNRVSAVGIDQAKKQIDNHFYFSQDPANKPDTFRIEANEWGKVTRAECRKAGEHIIKAAAFFDHPDDYLSLTV